MLQLVYEMLVSLSPEELKPVYIIASDTRVEVPTIEAYVEERITSLKRHAQQCGLPVYPMLVTPEIEQGFWFNLVGSRFRCFG